MHTSPRALIALVVALVALIGPYARSSGPPPAEAQRAAITRNGRLGDGDYIMEIPEHWRGGLVVFAHGIQRGPGRGDLRMLPIASHVLAQGHAWIASGYRAREYQPHLFIEDLVSLRELFVKEIGPPRWSIIYGQS